MAGPGHGRALPMTRWCDACRRSSAPRSVPSSTTATSADFFRNLFQAGAYLQQIDFGRSVPMTVRAARVTLVVIALSLLAHGDEWNRQFNVTAKPELQVSATDARV